MVTISLFLNQNNTEPAKTAVSPSSSGQGTFPPGEGTAVFFLTNRSLLKAEGSCLGANFLKFS